MVEFAISLHTNVTALGISHDVYDVGGSSEGLTFDTIKNNPFFSHVFFLGFAIYTFISAVGS